jgi:YVTN family beta-propeller protein
MTAASAQQTNAPVAPDTIYIGRSGASATGISVVDLNGFGASTGNPTFDPAHPATEGNSNFPNNPNLEFQGSLLIPPLVPGTTTLDGGSAGVFTLTKDSTLDDLVLRSPTVLSVGDMMLGHALDSLYNDGPAPFGCQGGGGNLCAVNGKKVIQVSLAGPHTLQPARGGAVLNTVIAGENPISWAPHPNPPPLIFPPLCVVPGILGQEPTSIDTTLHALTNLLGPGDPFGQPGSDIPPSGLLATEQNAFFQGPGASQPTIGACPEFMIRQQIGHFLYVIDSVQNEIVVLNSNSMRVLAHITVPDPTELAMSPRLDLLAVTQRSSDSVAFIDIDPASETFHMVVHDTAVGSGPVGIAWTPDNEDILVCNQGSSSVSILSTATLAVRKVVRRGLDRPFAVAITPRQTNFGFQRNTYYAYILDRAGKVSLFESGPNGVNGWGFDDIIGQTTFAFTRAKAIQPDPIRLGSGVWIVHEDQLDAHGSPTGLMGGAVSNLVLDSTTVGAIPLGSLEAPNLRGLSFRIERSIGSDQLTGIPTDIAFDDLQNVGALRDAGNPFSTGRPVEINGKNLVRQVAGGSPINTNQPTYMFLPVRTGTRAAEVIDVVRLGDGQRIDTNAFHAGIQSIPAGGAALAMDYFRQ